MPSQARSLSPSGEMKREASYEPSDEDIKPKKLKGSSSKAPGRTWTSDELDLLFTIALTGPTRANFDGKIEGRTALQCQKTNTLLPYLHKMAREKGAKKK